ncbi:MAG: universal stress protein [Nonlabens sp.]
MKNIVIPVDFSNHSETALKAGASLAKKHGAKLHVLHMLELSESIISSSSEGRNNEMMFLLQLANKKFEPFLDKGYLEGVEVEAMVKHHKVYAEVDAIAADLNADLIIMGSSGKSRESGIFSTGSNTSKMIRNSETPVLVIKEGQEYNFNHAVLATDLSLESIKAYERAKKLFQTLGCDYRSVFVNRPDSSFLSDTDFIERAEEYAHAGGPEEVINVNDYSIEAGLLAFSDRNNVDLIAVSTHARKGADYFFNGSISESVAQHSDLPVLAFKL